MSLLDLHTLLTFLYCSRKLHSSGALCHPTHPPLSTRINFSHQAQAFLSCSFFERHIALTGLWVERRCQVIPAPVQQRNKKPQILASRPTIEKLHKQMACHNTLGHFLYASAASLIWSRTQEYKHVTSFCDKSVQRTLSLDCQKRWMRVGRAVAYMERCTFCRRGPLWLGSAVTRAFTDLPLSASRLSSRRRSSGPAPRCCCCPLLF